MKILSLKNQLLAMLAVIIISAIALALLVTFFVSRQVLLSQAEDNASNQLASVALAVENQYESIVFYRESMLRRRKMELESLMDVAFTILETNFESSGDGRESALAILKRMRYDDGIGYFWINDTRIPVPRMIMHPTRPELDGQILADPEFESAVGSEKNLFVAAVVEAGNPDGGFVQYEWPKPTARGLTEQNQPKLSYVRLFEPWDWVVGSGVYIDDIERDTDLRIQAALQELRRTLGTLKIGQTGYYFIFDGEGRILLHPVFQNLGAEALVNPETGQNLLETLTRSVAEGREVVAYDWNKPEDPDRYHYKKLAFLSYFEPLDWYIASSLYLEDIQKPLGFMASRIILFAGGLAFLVFILSQGVIRKLMRPLENLTGSVETLDSAGLPTVRIPVEGPQETSRLGEALQTMVASIQSSRDFISGVVDAMPSLIIGLNRDGTIQGLNNAARKTATGSVDPIGRKLSSSFPHYQTIEDEIGKALSAGLSWFEVNRHRNSADGVVYESFNLYPLMDGGAVLRIDDVTERVRLEELMIQSEKMLSVGGLAAGMAHEINNPLAGIVQNIEVLTRRMNEEQPANLAAASEAGISLDGLRRYIEIRDINTILSNVRESGLRAAELVRNMLSFSRKGDRTRSGHDIGKLLDMTVELVRTDYDLKRHIDFKSVEIQKDYDVDAPPIPCESTKIQQVFLNIIKNAAEEMFVHGTWDGEAPRITLRTHWDGAGLNVSIEDNGRGMDEAVRRRVFEPFFTTKEVGEGTGLGLSVSYFIVTEHHEGTMSVESSPDSGTRFVIHLPGES